MKPRRAILANVLALTVSSSAVAQIVDKEICDVFSDLAGNAMLARQSEISVEEFVEMSSEHYDNPEIVGLLKGLVEEAYTLPLGTTKEDKMAAVKLFTRQFRESTCAPEVR